VQQLLPRRLRRFRTGNLSMLVNHEFLKGQSYRYYLSSRSIEATRLLGRLSQLQISTLSQNKMGYRLNFVTFNKIGRR